MNERTIFFTALDKPDPHERDAWLAESCSGDPRLRQRVEELLRAYTDAGSFLEHSPLEAPPTEPARTAMDAGATPRAGEILERTHVATGMESEVSLEFLGPPARPEHLGTLGPYEITQFVGRGGMGVVLKGHDTRLNRVAAIKVLAPELASNPTARKRFLREAQAAAAVSHDHVVTIHAIDETGGLPYLVMEYIAGLSLQQRIDRSGPLELKEILRIGRQMAAGLAAAHEQGLVHRDIKPANILLENGVERVKITDFGLARAVDDVSMTQTGVVAGTPQYMSPEQAQGQHVDHRSDLFSLGCVLYAMCTGRPPFRAESTIAVIRRVCDDRPRPIAEINAEIPEWLAAIIDRLLEKRPEHRFQSAADVAELLGQYLAHVQNPELAPRPEVVIPSTVANLDQRNGRGAASRISPFEDSVRATRRSLATPTWMWLSGMLLAAATLMLALIDMYVVDLPNRSVGPPMVALFTAWLFAVMGGLYLRHVRTQVGATCELPVGAEGPDDAEAPFPFDSHPGSLTSILSRLTRSRSWATAALVLLTLAVAFGFAEATGVTAVVPTIIRLVTGEGTLVVEVDDPSVAVQIDGEELVITGAGVHEVRVRAGKHRVQALKHGRPVKQEFVTISRGGQKVVKIELQPPPQGEAAGRGRSAAPMQLTTVATLRGDASQIWCVAFAPDGGTLAAAGDNGTVDLWTSNGSEWTVLGSLAHWTPGGNPARKAVRFLAWSPDGRTLASAGFDTRIKLWNVETGESKAVLRGHADTVNCVSFSPDGRLLATAGLDRTIRLWDAATGKPLQTLTGHRDWVLSVAFSPDGRLLASTDRPSPDEGPGLIKLWDVATGKELRTLAGHENWVEGAAFSPDGQLMASASLDATVILWDPATGRRARTLRHDAGVCAVSFAPDGRTLATGESDGSINVWDPLTGQALVSIVAHENWVRSVAFSPDGRLLASGSQDGIVGLWHLVAPSQPAAGSANAKLRREWTSFVEAARQATTDAERRRLIERASPVLAAMGETTGLQISDLVSGLPDAAHDTLLERGYLKWSFGSLDEHRQQTYARVLQSLLESAGKLGFGGNLPSAQTAQDVLRRSDVGFAVVEVGSTGTQVVTWYVLMRDLPVPVAIPVVGITAENESEYRRSLVENALKLRDKPDTELPAAVRAPRSAPREIVRATRVLRGHQEIIHAVAMTPDGRYIISGSGTDGRDNTIRVWDAQSGDELRQLTGHTGNVMRLAVLPDGARLLSAGHDRTVRLWDLETGSEIRRFDGHTTGIEALAVSPDGRRAASAGIALAGEEPDDAIRLWDVETGEEIGRLEGHERPVLSLAFSPDGTQLLAGSLDRTVRLWDLESRQEIRRLRGPLSPVRAVAISPDGRFALAGCGADPRTAKASGFVSDPVRCVLYLWNLESGDLLRRFEGHSGAIHSVAFSPDGRLAVSGSGGEHFGPGPQLDSPDNTVRVWDVESGRELVRFTGHTSRVSSVAFSPDRRFVLSSSFDYTVRLWDVEEMAGTPVAPATSAIAMPRLLLRGHRALVHAVAVTPDGRFILSGGGDSTADTTIRIWDAQTGTELRRLQGHKGTVTSLAISLDGRRVLSGSRDHTMRLWDLDSGESLRVFDAGPGRVYAVAFAPDGRRAASGNFSDLGDRYPDDPQRPVRDHTVRVWDIETGEELRRIEGHERGVMSVAFSPDGAHVASGSLDATARVWDVESGREIKRLRATSYRVNAVAFSPDGQFLLTGSGGSDAQALAAGVVDDPANCLLTLWDLENGRIIRQFRGHAGAVHALAFSPDGRLIVSASGGEFFDGSPQVASRDNSVRLWDAASGRELCHFTGHTNTVQSVAFAPDGTWVVSGSFDQTVRRWDVPDDVRSGLTQSRAALSLQNSLGMSLRLIRAGEFDMGTPAEDLAELPADSDWFFARWVADRRGGETPQHRVRITRPFYMSAHEVTVGRFRQFVEATGYRTRAESDPAGGFGYVDGEWRRGGEFRWNNPGFSQGDDHPVCNVAWDDAVAFCRWLSEKEHATYRLPTEAEWECACRAGTTTRFSSGDDPAGLQPVANIADRSLARAHQNVSWAAEWDDGFPYTSPAGQFQPNAFGLYDMHGNAWEWCADVYDPVFYGRSAVEDPLNRMRQSGESEHVFRGGGFDNWPGFVRSTDRYSSHSDSLRTEWAGFRVVREVAAAREPGNGRAPSREDKTEQTTE